jgi:hypothetical protein
MVTFGVLFCPAEGERIFYDFKVCRTWSAEIFYGLDAPMVGSGGGKADKWSDQDSVFLDGVTGQA